MEAMMDCHEILRQLKMTRTELKLLCELAEHADETAYGKSGLGVHAPGARRRLLNKGYIRTPYRRIVAGGGARRTFDEDGGRISMAGIRAVQRARLLGWEGGGGGDDRLKELKRQYDEIRKEWRALPPDTPEDIYDQFPPRLEAIAIAVAATPATGFVGIGVKVLILAEYHRDGCDNEYMLDSLVADLDQLRPGEPGGMDLYADAPR
jgi:hypothetical protein